MIGPSLKEKRMRASPVSNERGIALAVAIFALVIIGALVAGTFFAGRLEQQTGQNTVYAMQASEAAEAGLSDGIASQTAAGMQALVVDPGMAANLPDMTTSLGAHVSVARTISRLTDNVFLVRSTGTLTDADGGKLAVRGLGQLIRLNQAEITVNAGLTALGDVTISGGADVTGKDGVPSAWSSGVECPSLTDKAGVRYNGGTLQKKGNGDFSGAPDSVKDATLNATDMKKDFDKLKALATLTVISGNPAATQPAYTGNPKKCDTSIQTNWGEPAVQTDVCSNYFPIIYHNGNLSLQGGRGQGILLVEGDLSATGGMVFYGPVFVTGTLSTTGNSNQGAKFYGGVIAGNVALDDLSKLAGGALVSYSSCAIHRALQNSAKIGTLAERSWVQLYN
jgi:Tfp pilus assembly protein PilX